MCSKAAQSIGTAKMSLLNKMLRTTIVRNLSSPNRPTATYLDNLLDSVQIAQMILEGGNDVQPALPGRLVAVLDVHPVLAGRSGHQSAIVQQWQMPRYVQHVAIGLARDVVVGSRLGCWGEDDSLGLHILLDVDRPALTCLVAGTWCTGSAHRRSSSASCDGILGRSAQCAEGRRG